MLLEHLDIWIALKLALLRWPYSGLVLYRIAICAKQNGKVTVNQISKRQ